MNRFRSCGCQSPIRTSCDHSLWSQRACHDPQPIWTVRQGRSQDRPRGEPESASEGVWSCCRWGLSQPPNPDTIDQMFAILPWVRQAWVYAQPSFASSFKYRDRGILAVRIFALIISRPTALYFGITIGRSTPGFDRMTCDPVARSLENPSDSKTRMSARQSTGLSFCI